MGSLKLDLGLLRERHNEGTTEQQLFLSSEEITFVSNQYSAAFRASHQPVLRNLLSLFLLESQTTVTLYIPTEDAKVLLSGYNKSKAILVG